MDLSLFRLFFCACLLPGLLVVASTEFKVGDEFGWQEPDANNTAFYTDWASNNRFQLGDSLNFEYQNDSVLVVDKWGYYHCNITKPVSTYNDGKTVIKLDNPGPYYFISGLADHCKNGERLLVNVMGVHGPDDQAPSPQPSFGVLDSVSSATTSVTMIMVVIIVTFMT